MTDGCAPGGRAWSALGPILFASLCACTGSIGDPGDHGEGPFGSPRGGASIGDPIDDSVDPDEPTEGTDPGRKSIHRLNRVEYNATVQDVLGTSLAPATESWRGGENYGFDNIADFLGIDELQYQRYFDAATEVARDVFSADATRARIVVCDAADNDECVERIIGETGLRVFRRPLEAAEITTYARVYEAARTLGETHEGSLEQVLRALLSSAEFLYRIEIDSDPSSTAPHPLSPYELASRLSYFLWSSAPDDALLASAAEGSIADTATLSSAVDRMLDDPKSSRFIQHFVGQWLGARRVGSHAVTEELFPDWSAALAESMSEEIIRYFDEFFRTDRSYLEFLKADVNFVDENLARLYGIGAPGSGMTRIEATQDNRAGFLGLGGFLALSSYEYRTAPTLRGRWILINLLCSPPPDPPPDVPALDSEPGAAGSAEQSIRERLAAHREDPVCASCHDAMDPYGLALEHFDAIGKYRSTYTDGTPIDVSTALPDGTAFAGLDGVAEVVTDHPKFTRCVAEKLFVYGLGRGVLASDRPYLAGIDAHWREETPTLRRLVKSLIASEPFTQRRGEAE